MQKLPNRYAKYRVPIALGNQREPTPGFLFVLLPRVKLLLDISTGWPAHQMHSCLLLILITWKLENATLHLEQEGLSCFGLRG